jgi:hypothetical protein
MHKDATATRFEDMQLARAFEEKYGREMTPEEKKFISLSDIMFRHEYLMDSLNPGFGRSDSDDGSHEKRHHRSQLPVRLMSNDPAELRKNVA